MIQAEGIASTTSAVDADFDVRPYIDGIGAILAGPANVIMQLALAPVGYGVLESKVESGQITRHPYKRARTTFSYLAVALLGDDSDRQHYREAVNGQHRLVRSDPTSPVRYNAFDPALQLWVAACLYYGAVDVYARLYGPIADAEADALYRHCARFGTTLQVKQEMWPSDRDAFAEYWAKTSADARFDEPVREYLLDLIQLRQMRGVPPPVRRFTAWVSTGFLPPLFRERLDVEWTADDERRFVSLLHRIGTAAQLVPGPVRRLPISGWLWDVRRRTRRGKPLV